MSKITRNTEKKVTFSNESIIPRQTYVRVHVLLI